MTPSPSDHLTHNLQWGKTGKFLRIKHSSVPAGSIGLSVYPCLFHLSNLPVEHNLLWKHNITEHYLVSTAGIIPKILSICFPYSIYAKIYWTAQIIETCCVFACQTMIIKCIRNGAQKLLAIKLHRHMGDRKQCCLLGTWANLASFLHTNCKKC